MRESFGPFRGYTSSVERWRASKDLLVGPTNGTYENGSKNLRIDGSGLAYKRGGCAIQFDTLGSGYIEQTGLLPGKWGAVARRLRNLSIDGPTLACLYTKEEQSASFPSVDTGYFSNLYARLGSTNWTLLSEWGTAGYPTATGQEFYLKVEPLWYESGAGGYTRGAHELARRFLVSGSRDMLESDGDIYFPNLRGTPMRWNAKGNESSGSVTNRVRVGPNGPIGPLWGPTAAAGDTTTDARLSVFKEGDFGYFSVAYRYRDGSYSAPYIPGRADGFTLGTPGGTTYYKSIELTNVPLGGPDVVGRVILATDFTTLSSATAAAVASIEPGELKVVGYMDDNTRTAFSITIRNPDEIANNDEIVRTDLVCPRRAAHMGTGDQRAIIGRTLPNMLAIQIVPASVNAAFDLNFPDDNIGLYGSTRFVLRLTSTNLELFKTTGTGNAQNFGGGGNGVQFSLATFDTLQKLCDAVNATTTSSLCGGWRATVCPGVDPTAPSSGLLPTTSTVANCTTNATTTLTTSGSFADVAIGALVSGTNIAAGTYVKSKESATSITLSQAATGSAGSLSITFSFDLGDDFIMAATERGYMRCFGTSYRGFLYFKRTARPGYDRVDDSSLYFTLSSPGAASTGISLAPRCWPADNRRSGPGRYGAFMGIVDLEGGALCAWRNGIDMLINVRGVNTGEDFDIRRMVVNGSHGCISWPSLVSANGCAFYLTRNGVRAADKQRREVDISLDLYNAERQIGDLSSAVIDCAESSAEGTDNQYVHAAILDNSLAVSIGSAVFLYDFAKGLSASGLDLVVEPRNQRPYGWSTPLEFLRGLASGARVILNVGCMGSVPAEGGDVLYAASATNAGTGDGRIERILSGDSDNGGVALAAGYTAEVVAPAFSSISITRGELMHNSLGAAAAVFALRHIRDRGDYATYRSRVVASDSDELQQQGIPFDQVSQSPSRMMAFAYVSDGETTASTVTSTGRGFWGLEVELELLEV